MASTLLSAGGEAPRERPATVEPVAVADTPATEEAYTPEVVLAVPASAATARPDVVVKLLFSMSMDTETAAAAFSVTGGDGELVSGSLAWDVSAMVSAFRPDEPLAEGPYQLRVDRSACNVEGVELAESFATSFTVHQPSSQNDKPYAG